MKLMYTVVVQIIALTVVIIAGTLLNNDLAEGPRDIHRLAGMLAGLVGLIVVVQAFIMKASTTAKALATAALVLTILAAGAGSALKNTDNYDRTFKTMRLAGTLALFVSIGTLTQSKEKSNQSKNAESKKGDQSESE